MSGLILVQIHYQLVVDIVALEHRILQDTFQTLECITHYCQQMIYQTYTTRIGLLIEVAKCLLTQLKKIPHLLK